MVACLLAVIVSISPCDEGLRGDPAIHLVNKGKHHWIHFLPYEWETCSRYKALFVSQKIDIVCGCKQAKNPGEDDTVLLKCAYWLTDDTIVSQYAMTFYYYPDSISACNRTRNILMFGDRYRKR